MPLQLRKRLNLVKLLASYATGLDLRFKPVLVDIEPTNRCNLRCTFCPREEQARPFGRMDVALLRSVVDQTADTAMEYHFNLHGEPTLHPNLAEMVDYVAAAGGKALVYTNFSQKKDEVTDALAMSGADRVIVNVSGADEVSYAANNVLGDFEQVVHNLRRFRGTRDGAGKKRPRLVVSFVRTSTNAEVADRAREVFGPLCDYFALQRVHDWLGVEKIRQVGGGHLEKPRTFTRCSRLWTGVTVLWDGRLAACCYDYNGEQILGDVNVDTVEAIWSSERLRTFRRNNFDARPCDRCPNADPQFSLRNTIFRLRAGRGD